jgi:3-hydroxypropanoate dehydrogenase
MTTTDVAAPGELDTLDEAGLRLLFTEARTANTFAPTPVTDDELSAIWQVAKWAPTSANTQPLRVLYVRTAEGKARLVPHMSEGNRAKTATAPAVAVLALDNRFHEHMPTLLPFRPEMRDMFEANEPMRTRLSSFNAALQAGYFILSVRAHGLAAGPMGGFDADGIDAEFFSENNWHAVLVVNIGHPGEGAWFERLPRLDEAEVVRWA